MNITQETKDLVSVLTLSIAKEDYLQPVQKTLTQQTKRAQIKGFRKGKVPASLVKKMYGNAILADEINSLINKQINEYLQNEKLDIIGQPIPVNQENITFDIYNPSDFTFQYKVGLRPEIELDYLSSNPSITQYEIEITEDLLQKEIDHILSQNGEVENPDGKPEDKDAIEVLLKELDEEGNVKQGGYEHTSFFSVDQLKLKKDQTAIGKLMIGETYSPFNVYRAFDKEKDAIAKQILELDEEVIDTVGEAFELTLNKINRVEKAELNQELFDKVYGEGKISSEEEMKEKIKENLTNYFATASDSQLKNDIYKELIESTNVSLPDEFLKEWLTFTKKDNDDVQDQDIEQEYPSFAKNLKTSFVFNAVAQQAEATVEENELIEKIRENLIEQFKYYGMPLEEDSDMLDGMVKRFIENKEQVEQVHNQLMDDKIFTYLKENVKLQKKVLSLDEFNALNKD